MSPAKIFKNKGVIFKDVRKAIVRAIGEIRIWMSYGRMSTTNEADRSNEVR